MNFKNISSYMFPGSWLSFDLPFPQVIIIYSVLIIKFLVCLHSEYNTSLALWKNHANLLLQSFQTVLKNEPK